MTDISVVIPAYNEAATIRDIAHRTLAQVRHVIVVDDGSTDATCQELEGVPVTLIRHPKNLGKAASLWDGIQEALRNNASAIVTLDADGQHRPEDIPRLLDEFRSFPDHIVIGARLADKLAIPAKRYYANKIANFWISWAAGYRLADSQSGFRVYPARLFHQLRISVSPANSFVFESEILIKAARHGIHSKPVRIAAIYTAGTRPSHFRGVRDITHITRMVAWQLITHGMSLPGLYRSTIQDRLPLNKIFVGADGYAMLALSTLLILLSGGLSLLATAGWVLYVARQTSNRLPVGRLAVVLGMRLTDNQPNHDYYRRLDKAGRFLQASTEHHVLLLGGHTATSTVSEAAAGKSYLQQQGFSPDRILLEEDSRSTLENLQLARPLLRDQGSPVILVSNRYHLARSHALANGIGIQHQLCAAEPRLLVSPSLLFRILKEAFHLHWYYTGRLWARLTRNKKMLARIN